MQSIDASWTQKLSAESSRLWLTAGYVAAFLFFHWITFFSEYSDIGVTPWNPETGLAFALAWMIGSAAAPITFIAAFLGALITDNSVDYGPLLLRSLIYALVYTSAGLLLRQARAGNDPTSVRFLSLMLLAAGLAAAGFTVLWLSTLAGIGVLAIERFYTAVFTAATGDLIGILTIAPVIMVASRYERIRQAVPRHGSELLLGTIAIIAIAYIVFGLDSTDQFKVFYLVFIPVVALAMRLGFEGAAYSIVVSDVAMMVTIYFRDVTMATATELQVLMISLSATGLLLGSVVSERSRLAADLQASMARLHDAQSALQHASRVMLVNELASAIAHELNQPLSAIRNFVRAIERSLSRPRLDRRRLSELAASAVREVDGASTIIQETKQFLKKDISSPARADVRDAVSISLRMLQSELRRTGARTEVDLQKDLPPPRIDGVRLQQVLLNVLRNAADAVAEQPDNARIIRIAARVGGRGAVEIAVEDSGPGVGAAVRSRLFQPFTTSKKEGLGLGLSLSRSIVEDHGGELTLDHAAGVTRFVIRLPAAQTVAT